MTLPERLADAQTRAMRLYLQRQQIEAQRQHFAQQSVLCDQAMLKSDGEIALIETLIAESAGTGQG
jgi:hypothetical protein